MAGGNKTDLRFLEGKQQILILLSGEPKHAAHPFIFKAAHEKIRGLVHESIIRSADEAAQPGVVAVEIVDLLADRAVVFAQPEERAQSDSGVRSFSARGAKVIVMVVDVAFQKVT